MIGIRSMPVIIQMTLLAVSYTHLQSAKFIENHGGNINKISVFGQDSNPTTWKMAQMNLAIRGIEADLGKFNACLLYTSRFQEE